MDSLELAQIELVYDGFVVVTGWANEGDAPNFLSCLIFFLFFGEMFFCLYIYMSKFLYIKLTMYITIKNKKNNCV